MTTHPSSVLVSWVLPSYLLFSPSLGLIPWLMSGSLFQIMNLTFNLPVWSLVCSTQVEEQGITATKNLKIFWHNWKLQTFQRSRSLWSCRDQKIPEKALGLCLLPWCFHFLAVAACAPDCVTQRIVAQKKKKKKRKEKKSQQLTFPMIFPMALWYTPPSLLSHRVLQSTVFSARCVDSVTDAYPFSCRPLCVFKQLENTSVLTEIVTIIKHHQPHRFSLFVFYLTFFYWNLSKVWLWTSNLYTQSNSKYKHNTGILQ